MHKLLDQKEKKISSPSPILLGFTFKKEKVKKEVGRKLLDSQAAKTHSNTMNIFSGTTSWLIKTNYISKLQLGTELQGPTPTFGKKLSCLIFS